MNGGYGAAASILVGPAPALYFGKDLSSRNHICAVEAFRVVPPGNKLLAFGEKLGVKISFRLGA